MDGILQNRIKPNTPPQATSFSDAKVNNPNAKALDSTAGGETSFRDLIANSNDDVVRKRVAQKNGDGTRLAKTDEEFARMMQDKVNRENLRKPQNNLDKDAFLKLFITQMQNQDPLNPDNSAEMAAQLAQFNGLEQMMNVNKNLEKMQNEAAVSRAVGLVDFVGKEVKLDNGKLRLEDGKVSDAIMTVDNEAPSATLEVRDSAGAIVATRDLGMLKKGDHAVEWNGINNKGEKAPNGIYTFGVVAKDMNNQELPIRVTSMVKVTGVDLKDAGGSFYTDLGKIGITEIASIGASGAFAKMTKSDKASGQQQSDGGANSDEMAAGLNAASEVKPEEVAPIGAAAAGNAASTDSGAGAIPPAVKPGDQAKELKPERENAPASSASNSSSLSRMPAPMMEFPFAGR